MDVSDLKSLFVEVKKRMDGHIDHVRRELGGVRTGRASVNILDTVHVEAYGSMVPLNQVASLSVPEPAMIIAQPFDPSMMNNVEKGIRAANIGLNPTNDGKVIRIPIPALTDERRKELSKIVHKFAEEGRNGIRLVRREANDKLKKLLKDATISQDDERRSLEEVQKITDQHVTLIDDIQKKKDTELLGK
jgi:ribosome recycling factor